MHVNSCTAFLFDYDLTLYTADEHYVLDALDRRITLFVQKTLHSDFDTAARIRKEYLVKYGTTLSGLSFMHGVSPNDFFDFIHTQDGLVFPEKSPEKRAVLQSLPGRKFVFTNGRFDWSFIGLYHMGILDLFEGIFDLSLMRWIGKPAKESYDGVKDYLKARYKGKLPKQIVMLDDSEANLIGGKRAGFETVYVNPKTSLEKFDAQIHSILELPGVITI